MARQKTIRFKISGKAARGEAGSAALGALADALTELRDLGCDDLDVEARFTVRGQIKIGEKTDQGAMVEGLETIIATLAEATPIEVSCDIPANRIKSTLGKTDEKQSNGEGSTAHPEV